MRLRVAQHNLWVFLVVSLAIGCSGNNDYFLDSSIPRVVTSIGQIATVRTRWLNGKLQETTFLDKQVSHRFAYDQLGRRILAWYDLMYLGRFYIADGPDTIRYEYGRRNRPVREIHRYTTDMRNKREVDTTALNKADRRNIRDYRQRFFDKQRTFFNSNRTDTVEYQYEPFEVDKHLPLHVSQDIGY